MTAVSIAVPTTAGPLSWPFAPAAGTRLRRRDDQGGAQGNEVQATAQREAESEDIELVLTPLAELPGLVREGKIHNGMGVVALFWWLLETGQLTWPR